MWASVSTDGVAPSRMVGVSASVNLPLHHKVQKFSSGCVCVCVRVWSHRINSIRNVSSTEHRPIKTEATILWPILSPNFVHFRNSFTSRLSSYTTALLVQALRLIRHKIVHFGDVLPSQFLGILLKKLYLTQPKQTIQEQNSQSQNGKHTKC